MKNPIKENKNPKFEYYVLGFITFNLLLAVMVAKVFNRPDYVEGRKQYADMVVRGIK